LKGWDFLWLPDVESGWEQEFRRKSEGIKEKVSNRHVLKSREVVTEGI
jgi:hypothetical protein